MPLGLLVTVPAPAKVTFSCGVAGGVNLAVTNWLELNMGAQAPLPVQGEFKPSQSVKTEPLVAVAVSVTCVPVIKLAPQVPMPGQVMPLGLLVTVPVPAPTRLTRSPEVFGVNR
jgi:hypothetical protein